MWPLLFKSLPTLEFHKQAISKKELPTRASPSFSAGPCFHAEGSSRRPWWWQSSECDLRFYVFISQSVGSSTDRVISPAGSRGGSLKLSILFDLWRTEGLGKSVQDFGDQIGSAGVMCLGETRGGSCLPSVEFTSSSIPFLHECTTGRQIVSGRHNIHA